MRGGHWPGFLGGVLPVQQFGQKSSRRNGFAKFGRDSGPEEVCQEVSKRAKEGTAEATRGRERPGGGQSQGTVERVGLQVAVREFTVLRGYPHRRKDRESSRRTQRFRDKAKGGGEEPQGLLASTLLRRGVHPGPRNGCEIDSASGESVEAVASDVCGQGSIGERRWRERRVRH